MSTIRKAATLGLLVVGSLGIEASDAVAQHFAMAATSSKLVSPSIRYWRHDWVVDMRRGDGDSRRHTCLSGVFARDGAYYPFHDQIDHGSLQHVDRFSPDGRGGYYRQRGFIWMSHESYRESTSWTHYRRTLLRRVWRPGTDIVSTSKGQVTEQTVGENASPRPVFLHQSSYETGLQE